MIGFSKNTYLIACKSYIYSFSLYGRTIINHIFSGGGGFYDFVGRIYDTLRKVAGVENCPLCLDCH